MKLKKILSDVLKWFSGHKFLCVSSGLAILACAFQFWIAYPGYIDWDSINLLTVLDDWEVLTMAYIFRGIFFVFGKHVWVALLVLIIPFYLGLWVLSQTFYLRYKSWWSLLLFAPMFIQNVFIQNFFLLSSSYTTTFSFLLYVILLHIILVPKSRHPFFWLGSFLVMYLLTLFSRHNGIVQAFPACLILVYLYLKTKKLTVLQFINRYILITGTAAILSILLFLVPSHVLPVSHKVFPAQHILVNQLAGICVPANDSSCFDENWYIPGKTFEDVKKTYSLFPTSGNQMAYHNTGVSFMSTRIEAKGIEKRWLWAIFKYPEHYLRHAGRLLKEIWFAPMQFVEFSPIGSKSPFYEKFNFQGDWQTKTFSKVFPENELYLHETPLKLKLLHIWDDYLPKIPTIAWVLWLFLMTFISFILLLKSRDKTLPWFIFVISGCGVFAAVIYGVFYPDPFPRYMLPLMTHCIITGVAFVAFLLDKKEN